MDVIQIRNMFKQKIDCLIKEKLILKKEKNIYFLKKRKFEF